MNKKKLEESITAEGFTLHECKQCGIPYTAPAMDDLETAYQVVVEYRDPSFTLEEFIHDNEERGALCPLCNTGQEATELINDILDYELELAGDSEKKKKEVKENDTKLHAKLSRETEECRQEARKELNNTDDVEKSTAHLLCFSNELRKMINQSRLHMALVKNLTNKGNFFERKLK